MTLRDFAVAAAGDLSAGWIGRRDHDLDSGDAAGLNDLVTLKFGSTAD